MLTRRFFLRLLSALPLISVFPFFDPSAGAQPPLNPLSSSHKMIGETFAGEELYYDIAFWLLKKVAIVRMSFVPSTEKGRYVATLQGETVGLVGFFTSYRTDTYRAVMEELEGGRRLRSVTFEEQVRIGKEMRMTSHTFDHDRRKWIQKNVRMSGATSTQEQDIPEGQDYNDFLTASYNFRYGVYGTAERGKKYRIPVFPKKGTSFYEVVIASKTEEQKTREAESVNPGSEYRIELHMDPEVLQSKAGVIDGWLAKELYPVEGIMKDVFLFGDVRGTLTQRVIRPPASASPDRQNPDSKGITT
jgi:hypothetical protein